MKIGFPAAAESGKQMGFFSRDFVESGLIGVYDADSNEVKVVSKDKIGSLLEWLINEKIETIITPELTAMALRVFKEHGISVFKAQGTMLALNIHLLSSKSLVPYSLFDINYKSESSCSSGCSSCSSSCN